MKTMRDILDLMEKKYNGILPGACGYPAIIMYDDESGRIVKDATVSIYTSSNVLFEFDSIEELISHLEEK